MSKRKGIWIPMELIENKQLDWTNKVLLSEIFSLHSQEKGCIASNKHFGDLLDITDSAASRRISKLKSWNYINTQNIYENNRCLGRKIVPLKQQNTTGKNDTNQEKEIEFKDQFNGTSQTNDTVVSQNQDSTSKTTNGVLPEQHDSTSQTTRGVLPERQEGTCQRNTNNTRNNTINKNTDINTIGIKQGPIQGPIPDVDKIISNSGCIKHYLSHDPGEIEIFKNKFLEYSNKQNFPRNFIMATMKYIVKDPDSWEEELLKNGIEKSLNNLRYYHEGDPKELAMLYAFALNIFNSDWSEL
jgi:hypothetical protein